MEYKSNNVLLCNQFKVKEQPVKNEYKICGFCRFSLCNKTNGSEVTTSEKLV